MRWSGGGGQPCSGIVVWGDTAPHVFGPAPKMGRPRDRTVIQEPIYARAALHRLIGARSAQSAPCPPRRRTEAPSSRCRSQAPTKPRCFSHSLPAALTGPLPWRVWRGPPVPQRRRRPSSPAWFPSPSSRAKKPGFGRPPLCCGPVAHPTRAGAMGPRAGCGTVPRPPDRPPVEAASGGFASLEGGYHGADWQLHSRRKRRLHWRNPHPHASRQGEYPPRRARHRNPASEAVVQFLNPTGYPGQ